MYVCRCCRSVNDRWQPRCPVCREIGAMMLHEELHAPARAAARNYRTIADAPDVPEVRYSAGIPGLDRVLGGGFVKPSVILFAAKPGCGKSTLLLPMMAGLRINRLLVPAEESDVRLRRRAVRCGLTEEQLGELPVLHSKDFGEIMATIRELDPTLVVIDSLNVLVDPANDNPRDTDYNLLRNANALYADANENDRILILVSQMNKGDSVRGTQELQHLVDTVMLMEKVGPFRKLSCPEKNRDGSVDEVAKFLMTGTGLHEVAPNEAEDDGPVADRGEVIRYQSEADIPLPKKTTAKRFARRRPA